MMQERHATPWWFWAMAPPLLIIIFYPTLVWLITTWLGSPYYGHGILVPLISLVLAWRLHGHRAARATDEDRPDRRLVPGVVLAAMGLGAHFLAGERHLHVVSAGALVVVLGGAVLALGGYRTLRRLAFPVAFLFLMIPLPWLEASTPYLARGVASAAARLSAALGVDVVILGARIELPNTALVVGAPCSGVNSLGALVTFAVLYAFLVRGPLTSRLALMFLAVPIALLANLVRVLLVILLAHNVGAEAALGYFHDWSSLFLFLLAVGLLIAAGRALQCKAIRSDI